MQATLVLIHSYYSKEHLAEVTSEMIVRGAPTLRGVDAGEGVIYLLEGCHRARAAAKLGLTVNVVLVDYDVEADHDKRICDVLGDGDCDSEMGSVVFTGASGDQCVDCDVEIA